MKHLFRVIVLLVISLLFIACGPSITATPSPMPSSTATTTATATFTLVSSPTATAIIQTASGLDSGPPTLIPTIDPTLVPGLLSKAFSIQEIEGLNGHNIQQIMGWDYGFGGGFAQGSCAGYYWLDVNHLLIYPSTGQTKVFDQWGGTGIVPQPVVINLESGLVWLPPANESGSPLTCNRVYWSEQLGMLITTEYVVPEGLNQELEAVTTNTFDGQEIAHYWGNLRDVSPSGTKILIADDTLIDLRNNKVIDFDWYTNYDHWRSSRVYWNSDESRVYRCCYYYGDTNTGTSYNFEISELQGTGAKLSDSATHGYGEWVRDGDYFLIQWSVVDDGYPDFFPMFDPVAKKYFEVSEMAGVLPDWTCVETNVSPGGMYIWLECWEGSYLINLENFQSVAYLNYSNTEIGWSSNGQFAWIRDFTNDVWQILSVSSKELKTLSVVPISDIPLLWHPTENILAFLSEDMQQLELVDAQTMSLREIVLPTSFRNIVWSPTGDRLALLAQDGSLWLADYPKLEHLEQLTEPKTAVRDLVWSPDGTYISFISGSDIYIVDTMK